MKNLDAAATDAIVDLSYLDRCQQQTSKQRARGGEQHQREVRSKKGRVLMH